MANYTQLFYHFIWTTKEREPLITPDIEWRLYGQIRHKCEELKVLAHEINGMPDHVHLACSLPVTLGIADFMEKVKGSSSHFANHALHLHHHFQWRPGFGALTFARRDLRRVAAYIRHQKRHHAENILFPELETFEEQE